MDDESGCALVVYVAVYLAVVCFVAYDAKQRDAERPAAVVNQQGAIRCD